MDNFYAGDIQTEHRERYQHNRVSSFILASQAQHDLIGKLTESFRRLISYNKSQLKITGKLSNYIKNFYLLLHNMFIFAVLYLILENRPDKSKKLKRMHTSDFSFLVLIFISLILLKTFIVKKKILNIIGKIKLELRWSNKIFDKCLKESYKTISFSYINKKKWCWLSCCKIQNNFC